jgi:predicted Zn-dependent protease
VEYGSALASALAGDFARSEAAANDLLKHFPEDTSVARTYVPLLQALAALGRGQPAEAIDRLRPAMKYELAMNRLVGDLHMSGLYPAWVRGRAYLEMHRGAEAAAEFRKIQDHPGIVFADPIGALAGLDLGRAYAMSGDTKRAKDAWQDFLAVWKNADPDIPALREAKAEFAKL